MTTATSAPILEARGLVRSFGAVRALNGADFEVYPGEVVGLIGDNGAGKSTMVKAMSGNLALDEGAILFDGRQVDLSSPNVASKLGIETVFQDLALAPHLTPAQNMFLGRELPARGALGKFGFLDNKTMRARSKKAFDELGATIRSYSDPVGRMSGGQRQAVAIARAVAWAKGVVFLDEPTAALGVVQTKAVLETIRKVRDQGVGVVFISHSMPHVLEVCDRVQVLRLGARVATFRANNTTVEELVGAMTGALDMGATR